MTNKIEGVNVLRNNLSTPLQFTADSGKIIYRDKVDTLIGIKHPGIILGDDIYGVTWIIHNHYQIGFPQIESLEKFAAGVKVLNDTRPVNYNQEEIVNRAIESWKRKEQYSWLLHNCQHFVNKVTANKNKSETLDRIANNLIGGGLTAGIAAAAKGKKGLAKAGLITATVGGLIKLINNL
jgi:hypothetical protein